jgi:transposase-like protein
MNQTPAKPRRKFDDAFRREALNHWLASGKSAETIAQELGLNANQLYAWKQRLAPADAGGRAVTGAKPATLAEAQAQLETAQREIRHLREQRDILKKTLGILSEPPPSATSGSTR